MEVSKVAPPHISSENRSGMPSGVDRGDLQHVVGAHARGQQRLVGVAEGRVGEKQLLLVAHPRGELLRAQFLELVAVPGGSVRIRLVAFRSRG